MSKNFKSILSIYLFSIVVLLSIYGYYSSNFYNTLVIIKNPQNNRDDLNIKIPDKITLSNPYLGNAVISDKSKLNELLKYFNKIYLTNFSKENTLPLENTLSISGEIYYLNGDKTSFEISNYLKLDDKIYTNNSSLINILRNNLKNAFYTIDNFESILSSPDNLLIHKDLDSLKSLSDNSKLLFLDNFKSLRMMNDNKDFLKTDLREIPKHHLTLYRYSKEGAISNNTFYIDVYDNYLIIQYLGDENGKNIYFKGNLDEKIFK